MINVLLSFPDLLIFAAASCLLHLVMAIFAMEVGPPEVDQAMIMFSQLLPALGFSLEKQEDF